MYSGFDLLLSRLRRHGRVLLALALGLIFLQTATLARSAPHVDSTGALTQICTAQGLVTVTASGEPVLPATSDNAHGCCSDCTLGTPVLPDTTEVAVSPAPTCGPRLIHASAPQYGRTQYRAPPSRAPPSA